MLVQRNVAGGERDEGASRLAGESRFLAGGTVLAAVAAALLIPAAAQAAAKPVYAGPPVAKARALPENSTGNAFYPRTAVVKAGGKVAFKFGGLPAGDVVRAGSDRKEVAFLAFFPRTRHVNTGESVRFQMSSRSTEIHNVVFGPDDFVAQTAAGFISPGAQGIAYNPASVYPSHPGALVLDGANHGNGFLAPGCSTPTRARRSPRRSR